MPKFETKRNDLYIDGKKVLKAFESWNGFYWFATEKAYNQDSLIDGKVYKNDTIYYGFVQGQFDEWGYFSQAEIEALKPKVWEIPKKALPHAGRRR